MFEELCHSHNFPGSNLSQFVLPCYGEREKEGERERVKGAGENM